MEFGNIKKTYSKLEPNSLKKILGIQGSPREPGITKTDILLQAFLEGCRDGGAETETIYLREKEINPCTGCFTCWTKTPGKCIFNDDVADIIRKEMDADLSVYAYPLYHFGLNSLFKKYIERTLPIAEPYFIEKEDGETTHPIRQEFRAKNYIVVMGVCGFPEVSHFGAASTHFHYLANAGGENGLNIVAEIYRPMSEILKNPYFREETNRVLDLVKDAGTQLIKTGTINQDTIDSIAEITIDKKKLRDQINKMLDSCIKNKTTLPTIQKQLNNIFKQ